MNRVTMNKSKGRRESNEASRDHSVSPAYFRDEFMPAYRSVPAHVRNRDTSYRGYYFISFLLMTQLLLLITILSSNLNAHPNPNSNQNPNVKWNSHLINLASSTNRKR